MTFELTVWNSPRHIDGVVEKEVQSFIWCHAKGDLGGIQLVGEILSELCNS